MARAALVPRPSVASKTIVAASKRTVAAKAGKTKPASAAIFADRGGTAARQGGASAEAAPNAPRTRLGVGVGRPLGAPIDGAPWLRRVSLVDVTEEDQIGPQGATARRYARCTSILSPQNRRSAIIPRRAMTRC